jgi:hypothetical protein
MSSTVSSVSRPTPLDERKLALAAVLASAVMTAVLVVRNTNDGPAWRVSLVLGTAIALMSWIVFGVAVPRARNRNDVRVTARRSLVLGVVTLLATAAFWMAVQPVFAAGALLLAAEARARSADGRLPATAAIGVVLTIVGLLAGIALTV